MRFKVLTYLLAFLIMTCQNDSKSTTPVFTAHDLRQANTVLLEGVMDGAFSPPVASRIYAYSHIANYLTIQSFYKDSLVDLSSKLNDLKDSKTEARSLLSFGSLLKQTGCLLPIIGIP